MITKYSMHSTLRENIFLMWTQKKYTIYPLLCGAHQSKASVFDDLGMRLNSELSFSRITDLNGKLSWS